MEKHNKQWFHDRIGKRVYRTQNTCQCEVCQAVYHNGLLIADQLHATYLYDIQNELNLFYSDTKLP
jgi:hypothetical protein